MVNRWTKDMTIVSLIIHSVDTTVMSVITFRAMRVCVECCSCYYYNYMSDNDSALFWYFMERIYDTVRIFTMYVVFGVFCVGH